MSLHESSIRLLRPRFSWTASSVRYWLDPRSDLSQGRYYGYDIPPGIAFDYRYFVERRAARIRQLNGIYESNWAKEGIDLYHAVAKFINSKTLEVTPTDGSDSWQLTFDHATIATGRQVTPLLTDTTIRSAQFWDCAATRCTVCQTLTTSDGSSAIQRNHRAFKARSMVSPLMSSFIKTNCPNG